MRRLLPRLLEEEEDDDDDDDDLEEEDESSNMEATKVFELSCMHMSRSPWRASLFFSKKPCTLYITSPAKCLTIKAPSVPRDLLRTRGTT